MRRCGHAQRCCDARSRARAQEVAPTWSRSGWRQSRESAAASGSEALCWFIQVRLLYVTEQEPIANKSDTARAHTTNLNSGTGHTRGRTRNGRHTASTGCCSEHTRDRMLQHNFSFAFVRSFVRSFTPVRRRRRRVSPVAAQNRRGQPSSRPARVSNRYVFVCCVCVPCSFPQKKMLGPDRLCKDCSQKGDRGKAAALCSEVCSATSSRGSSQSSRSKVSKRHGRGGPLKAAEGQQWRL